MDAICRGSLNSFVCGALKGEHMNHKTLEINEFPVVDRHNVMLLLCTLNDDLKSWKWVTRACIRKLNHNVML